MSSSDVDGLNESKGSLNGIYNKNNNDLVSSDQSSKKFYGDQQLNELRSKSSASIEDEGYHRGDDDESDINDSNDDADEDVEPGNLTIDTASSEPQEQKNCDDNGETRPLNLAVG